MHVPWFPDQWAFDWRSAIIGAIVAWLIAIVLYARRTSLRRLAEKTWAPIARWRTRLQRSVEEKYLLALREQLRSHWLLEPRHPAQIFVPPLFVAPSPLPNTFTEEFDPERRLRVPYDRLLESHSRILLTGRREEGRTATLIASLWHLVTSSSEGTTLTHFPLWIDLTQPAATALEEEKEAIRWLVELATQAFPAARPNWLATQLQERAALILVDEWDAVPADQRSRLARRIGEAADHLPQSHWLIATGLEGYGPLVEEQFVPTELKPPKNQKTLQSLYEGWTTEIDGDIADSEEEDSHQVLSWALETGDGLAELTLRVWLDLQTGQHPYPMREVLAKCVEALLPSPDLGEELDDVAAAAQQAAKAVLQALAWRSRMEGRTLSLQEIKESLLVEQLPPPEEQPPRLEATVLKMLQTTPFLQWQRKTARFQHPIWEDLWLAHYLAETEKTEVLLEHLDDPHWDFLMECYVGIAPVKPLIAALFKAGLRENALQTLLRGARWAILAPKETPWRKHVIKALAQSFATSDHGPEERLALGKALALVAEKSAHPFFLQMLRHPDAAVRAASFRGLGWTGGPRDVQTLAAGLNDNAFEVQTSAVKGLADLATPGAYRLLQDEITKGDERLTLVIAEALAQDAMGWESLKQAAKDKDLLVRRAAVHGISQIDAPWTQEILEHLMKNDPQWLVRSAAEAALSTKEASAETATVQPPPQLDEAAWLITWAAQQGLGVGVGDAVLQMLLRTLDAKEPRARLLGCVTLGRIGGPEHLAALETRVQEETDPDVKQAAEAARQQIKTRYRDRGVNQSPSS